MFRKSLFSLFTSLSLNLAFSIILSLGLSSLLAYAEISFSMKESISYHPNNPLFYVILVVSFLILLYISKLLNRVTDKNLFFLCSFIFLIGAMLLIVTIPDTIRTDAASIFDAAIKMNKGEYSDLEKSAYLGVYPFQLGLVFYDRLLISIYSSPRILYFTNILLVIGINFFSWKIVSSFSLVNDKVKKIVILFSFLFFPQFFFILFGYGTIPGFFFFILSCFFAQKFLYTNKKRYLLFVIVCLSISCILKSNYLIGAITLACIFLLYYLKNKSSLLIIAMLLCIFIPMNASNVMVKYYSYKYDVEISKGMPKILWITMGLQDNPKSHREVGWYNNYSLATYTKSNFDSDLASKIGKKDLQKQLSKFESSPQYMYSFFTKKIVSTWLEPSYQSMWSGPLLSEKKVFYYDFILAFMHVFITLVFLLSSYYYILCAKKVFNPDIFSLFPGIYFLGGFIFHLIWETKSQYVYTYVFLLIIPASFGFIAVYEKMKSHIKR